MDGDKKTAFNGLLNPVVLIALIIIFGVFALIGAAIVGIDKGVLSGMAKQDFARGLITYLFAVVTIGTAVVLVVSALTTEFTEEVEKKFQHGKEVLSLLLGVFGTIVGFYFGSETQTTNRAESALPRLSPPILRPGLIVGGQHVELMAGVLGGVPPYHYRLTLGDKTIIDGQPVKEDGWIVQDVKTPTTNTPTTLDVVLKITDAGGQTAQASAQLGILPAEGSVSTPAPAQKDAR